MKVGKINIFIFLVLLCSIILCACKPGKIYECDWILTHIEFKGEDISDYIGLHNMAISYSGVGTTAEVDYREFNDYTVSLDDTFEFSEDDNKEYLIIKGSKFFTDTFQIECMDVECCKVKMWNEEKYIEMIYNSELIPYEKRSRNCPYPWDVVDWIEPPYPHIRKNK